VYIPRQNATTANARYEIEHPEGIVEVRIEQYKWFDVWVSLGQFVFDEGTTQCIRLTDETGEGYERQVGFDAVKWIFTENR